MEIIVGTNNLGKLNEMQESLNTSKVKLVSYGEKSKKRVDFEETGTTFKENAVEKAQNFAKLLERPVLADDGGLILEAFPTLLGVKTARFFHEGTNDHEKNQQLFDLMAGETNRRITLFATLAYVDPQGESIIVEKSLVGELTHNEIGEEGYGFDRFFYLPEIEKTLAELPLTERNEYSPRVRALKEITKRILEQE